MNISQAEAYFATRLYAEAWEQATPANKTKALATAERHVASLRLREDVPSGAVTAAICEQALWLLSSTPAQRSLDASLARGLTSRTVGSASESYGRHAAQGGVVIAPEALSAVNEWIQRCRIGDLR